MREEQIYGEHVDKNDRTKHQEVQKNRIKRLVAMVETS
jgi:hypothetical protein